MSKCNFKLLSLPHQEWQIKDLNENTSKEIQTPASILTYNALSILDPPPFLSSFPLPSIPSPLGLLKEALSFQVCTLRKGQTDRHT